MEFTGFKSPNYTQAPNEFYDVLLPLIKDYSELKVVEVMIRLTFGYHQKRTSISEGRIAKRAGMEVKTVRRGIALAIEHGIIKKITEPTRSTPATYEICICEESPEMKLEQPPSKPKHRFVVAAGKTCDSEKLRAMALAISKSTGMDLRLNEGAVFKNAKSLLDAGYYAEQVLSGFDNRDGYWYKVDWRGKKGARPNIANILQTIATAVALGSPESVVIDDE